MKNTPEIRFKGFTDAWAQRKLGEVADIVRGASPRPIQDPKWFDDNSDIGWLRISDVTEQNGRIYYLDQKISEAGQSKTRVLTEPHLLLSIAATIGRPVINYIKTGVHDGFLIFLNPKFEQEFMFQWFEMFRLQWQQYGQPGSQVNLNSDLVKAQEILLPPSEEQTSIGNFFHTIDKIITIYKRKLDSLKQLKKAYLQQMFPQEGETVPKIRFSGFKGDWEEAKLGDVAEILAGGDVDKTKLLESGKYPVIANALTNDGIVGYYDNDYRIEAPAVTVTGRGDVGYAQARRTNFTPVVRLLSVKSNFDIDFLANKINKFDIFIESTGVPQLTSPQLSNYIITFPDKKEQAIIGNFLRTLDKCISLQITKHEQLKQLKSAYLQKMFI